MKRLPIYIVLDNIRSAFNVGSIFRTADATRVRMMLLCGISAYPPHNRLIKTSLGSENVVPWRYSQNTLPVVEELKEARIPIVAIEQTRKSISHTDFKFPVNTGVAIVLGHELRGVDPAILNVADYHVDIPMFGKKNSLNVANAAGIILYEILRQWGII